MKDVHTEHCCIIHGCKYGDENCTVVTKKAPQSYPCEDCRYSPFYDGGEGVESHISKIDSIDADIIKLVNYRAELAKLIVKGLDQVTDADPLRENDEYRQVVVRVAAGPISSEAMNRIFAAISAEMKSHVQS